MATSAAEPAVRCESESFVEFQFFVEFVSADESAVVDNCLYSSGQFHHASAVAAAYLVEHSLGSAYLVLHTDGLVRSSELERLVPR